MKLSKLFPALLLLFQIGCLAPTVWVKPGADQYTFNQESARCELYTNQVMYQYRAEQRAKERRTWTYSGDGYSGTITEEPNLGGGGFGAGIATGVLQGLAETGERTKIYELCMNSLGWMQKRAER